MEDIGFTQEIMKPMALPFLLMRGHDSGLLISCVKRRNKPCQPGGFSVIFKKVGPNILATPKP
jgi:hypothetical protein